MKKILPVLLLTLLTLYACSTAPGSQSTQALNTPPACTSLSDEIDITPYTGSLTNQELIEHVKNPDWTTVWLRGYYQETGFEDGYYVSAWLAGSGQGVVNISNVIRGKPSDNFPEGLSTASSFLTDGTKIFIKNSSQFVPAGDEWKIHPLEQIDPFLAFFTSNELIEFEDAQIIGASNLAGLDVVGLKSGDATLWVDEQRGVIMAVETGLNTDDVSPCRYMRVLELEYDVGLPHQVNQVVPTGDDRPGLYERPAPSNFDLTGLPIVFDWVSDNVNNPLAGSSIDVYQGYDFIGSLALGSSGLYCDRAKDGNHFAYLASIGDTGEQLRWVDLRRSEEIHSFAEMKELSAPVWSPDSKRLLFSARNDELGLGARKLILLNTQSGDFFELGEGSLVPPAWSDDGKFIYSLDGYYTSVSVWDGESLEQICTAAFDSQNWTVKEGVCQIDNRMVETKLPRSSFVYLNMCAEP